MQYCSPEKENMKYVPNLAWIIIWIILVRRLRKNLLYYYTKELFVSYVIYNTANYKQLFS